MGIPEELIARTMPWGVGKKYKAMRYGRQVTITECYKGYAKVIEYSDDSVWIEWMGKPCTLETLKKHADGIRAKRTSSEARELIFNNYHDDTKVRQGTEPSGSA